MVSICVINDRAAMLLSFKGAFLCGPECRFLLTVSHATGPDPRSAFCLG
jgi:hypothetical protein